MPMMAMSDGFCLPPSVPSPPIENEEVRGRGGEGEKDISFTVVLSSPTLPLWRDCVGAGGSCPLNWAMSSRQGNGGSKLPTQSQGFGLPLPWQPDTQRVAASSASARHIPSREERELRTWSR